MLLGIEEIYALVDDLIAAHGDWLPARYAVNLQPRALTAADPAFNLLLTEGGRWKIQRPGTLYEHFPSDNKAGKPRLVRVW